MKGICSCGHSEEEHQDIPAAGQMKIEFNGKILVGGIKQSQACTMCDCPGYGEMYYARINQN